MEDQRYFVELEVIDLDDSTRGGKQMLKLRFSMSKLDRQSLIHALKEEIVMVPKFPKPEEPK